VIRTRHYRALPQLLTLAGVCLLLASLAPAQTPQKLSSRVIAGNRPTAKATLPYVLVLPGILGEQIWDRRIRRGIRESQIPCEVEIYDWTKGPLMMISNIGGDEAKVAALVQLIERFNADFPDRPLFLVGHSGGSRMVIRILEELRGRKWVERAVLLSPGVEPTHNLSAALSATRSGIDTFYSRLDFPISVPLTFVKGLTELELDAPAATFGFEIPTGLSLQEQALYENRLFQHEYRPSMLSTGNTGGHFGWTVPRFVSRYIAPLLQGFEQ